MVDDSLTEALGYTFKDIALLETALTHPSAPRAGGGMPDYQRLEFLGDAVLELCVSRMLFDRFPDAKEGALTTMRASLVKKGTLSRVAKTLRLGDYIDMSPCDRDYGASSSDSVLCDVFEAVLAAIYLDGGIVKANAFVKRSLKGIDPEEEASAGNSKSALQEFLQSRGQATPKYHMIEVKGHPHAPLFGVIAVSGDRILGRGTGPSKKAAQQDAARAALAAIKAKPQD